MPSKMAGFEGFSTVACKSCGKPEALTFWGAKEDFSRKGAKTQRRITNAFASYLCLCAFASGLFYGSGGAGLSVPRSRLNTDDGSQAGIASSFAARKPINSITLATVRGPVQSQSGRTMSVGW